MLVWPRTSRLASLFASGLFGAVLIGALSSPTAAQAESPAAQAAKLATEGKGLSADGKNAEASEKFRQAVVLSPEGKYYFYLCVSLSKEGKLGEALNACDAVERNGADDKTLTKTKSMIDSLRADMKKQGMDPDKALAEGKNQDPATGGGASPAGGGSNAVAVPAAMPQYTGAPPVSVYGIPAVPHEYAWSVGAQFYGIGGQFGEKDAYEPSGGGFRLVGDVLLSRRHKFGVEAYIGGFVATAKDQDYDLTVVDFGLAGFKHFCRGRLCITPLAGLSFAGMQPDNGDDQVRMAALGVRGDVTAALALGSRFEHALSVGLGLNAYTAPVGDYEQDPEDFGLDAGSFGVTFALGYTYRFSTPIGRSPFITFD